MQRLITVRPANLARMSHRGAGTCPQCGRTFEEGERVVRTAGGSKRHTKWYHPECFKRY